MTPLPPLIIDLPPREAHPNARKTWQARARTVARYRKSAGELVFAFAFEQFGRRPRFARAIIGLRFRFPKPRFGRAQFHDPDNLLAWAKSAIDALTDGGLLADDRSIVYLPPEQELSADDVGQLLITVRPIVDGTCPFCGAAQCETTTEPANTPAS